MFGKFLIICILFRCSKVLKSYSIPRFLVLSAIPRQVKRDLVGDGIQKQRWGMSERWHKIVPTQMHTTCCHVLFHMWRGCRIVLLVRQSVTTAPRTPEVAGCSCWPKQSIRQMYQWPPRGIDSPQFSQHPCMINMYIWHIYILFTYTWLTFLRYLYARCRESLNLWIRFFSQKATTVGSDPLNSMFGGSTKLKIPAKNKYARSHASWIKYQKRTSSYTMIFMILLIFGKHYILQVYTESSRWFETYYSFSPRKIVENDPILLISLQWGWNHQLYI